MDEVERSGKLFDTLDHVPVGVFVLRKDFTVLFWNRCIEEWTGIQKGSILGTDIRSPFPHLNDPKYAIRLSDIFRGGPPAVFSSQLHRFIIPSSSPGGLPRIQHSTVAPLEAPGGEGFYALFVIQDVTDLTYRLQEYRTLREVAYKEIRERKQVEEELRKAHEQLEFRVQERTADLNSLNEQLQRQVGERKQAEDALRKSEERFRSIFENVSVGIALVGMNGSVLTVNEALCRFLGYHAHEILGRRFSEFVFSADKKNDRGLYEELLAGGRKSYLVDKRFVHDNGEVIWGRLTVSCIRDEDGHPQKAAVVCEDISERKKMQSGLLRAQKLESLGILAGGIAHDFNNLLTVILGNISLAKLQVGPGDELSDRMMEAEKASLRAKDLTQQLLTFSRGGAPLKKTSSIADLIQESAEFALRGSRTRCVFSVAPDLWSADVDEGQISQVINNLIINGAQAMPEGGTISVKAENMAVDAESLLPLRKGNYVKISISDEGVGIPEEVMESIFDPYFTTKPTGSGLGLSTSYSIVKNHGGYITLESQPGVGTTFYVYLPASRKEIPQKTGRDKRLPGKGSILVVDDEEMVRFVIGNMLQSLGYEAEFAQNGEEALRLYRDGQETEHPFDAVVIDLTIPGGMGGKETVRRLIEIDPEVKAIVSSGYSNDPVMAEYTKYGFSGVIAKPYTCEELSQVLHGVINGGDG
ncbi:MAG: PAS domain S-box protein [Thermodesulfovibrionales bacterium]|jgi:PAS domain S-box-containing protein